jgi:hypothetical protein
MKTFIIVSDSHGNRGMFERMATVLKECDYILHLGDTSSDGNYLKTLYGDKVTIINGNCDPVKLGQDECVLDVEGAKLFLCHGHLYGVKYGTQKLLARAKELGCQAALYGHTHRAEATEQDGIYIINPGTTTRYTLSQTYCYMVIHNGKIVPTIVNCPPKA